MYLEYCLFANIAICILSIILFLIMKKKKQASRKNIFVLIFCAVVAMMIVSLIPLIADFLVMKFSFSATESLIISLFLLAVPTLAILYLLMPVWAKQFAYGGKKNGNSIARYIEDYSEGKTDKNKSKERGSYIFKAAGADISAGNERENGDELQETERQDEGKLYTEEIHITSEEQNIPENKEVHTEVPTNNSDNRSVINRLINIAMNSKNNHNFQIAITAYERALTLGPDDELGYLIILDLCSLYKITGNLGSINKLLDSVQCNLLSEDKKEDIIRNIKNY